MKITEKKGTRSDRISKYGVGSGRLLLLLLLITSIFSVKLVDILSSVVSYAIFGIGGAVLNLHVLSTRYEVGILIILIATYLVEMLSSSSSGRTVLVFYLFKTIFGDGLGGKLDRDVWIRSLGIVFVLWILLSSPIVPLLPNVVQIYSMVSDNLIVFSSHLISHWICESGDNWYENVRFFRYRYSYECSLVLLLCWDQTQLNIDLVVRDMVASLTYRITNYVYTLITSESNESL